MGVSFHDNISHVATMHYGTNLAGIFGKLNMITIKIPESKFVKSVTKLIIKRCVIIDKQ